MIELLLVTVGSVIGAFALISPLESLRWWARTPGAARLGALTRPAADGGAALAVDAAPDGEEVPTTRYLVYLSGIDSVDGRTGSRREQATLAAVAERLPGVRVMADVFPYAVENRGLTQGATMWFWTRLQRLRTIPVANVATKLISLRNALRVLVSADPRYGPSFNLAVAHAVGASLSRHGYDWDARTPVTIIGYSGGGQIALGVCGYLAGAGVPVSVISIGGVLSDEPALDRVEHVWHLVGTRDRLQLLGPLVFPGRWPTAPLSAWHLARYAGRLTIHRIGPMRHMGGRDYFDRHATDPSGTSYRQLTVDAIVDALSEHDAAAAGPHRSRRRARPADGAAPQSSRSQ